VLFVIPSLEKLHTVPPAASFRVDKTLLKVTVGASAGTIFALSVSVTSPVPRSIEREVTVGAGPTVPPIVNSLGSTLIP